MWFWILMFFCNLLIPVIMIIVGYLMYKHPPKKINAFYGYRTSRSMKNDETWKFAHDYCGRIWIKLGFVLLIPTIIASIPFINSAINVVGIVTLVIQGVQVIVLIGSIFPVEAALKKNFDDNGNRR
ncbi:SdpI family protein [Acetivibrio clariflavus]|uniref:SdpI/YhfL protein family protein n=1 Tax=Acetivibrio clariflavus (strain DSM 19732 / NBRC 101661 / EBR45) TaxID=720554 RepID=G8LYJ1_ACECE|nr:SdpI family protein [Acetivibrio clariflavus]AEV69979.1 hypothetical protein Clocl_3497 [Acetivibrio clariflavus DSM 19732]